MLVGQGSTFPESWGFTDSRHLLPEAERQPTRRAQARAFPRVRACVRTAGRQLSLQALSLLPPFHARARGLAVINCSLGHQKIAFQETDFC